jgi:phage terminase Nu1 subunit (DNA packaging protein)
VKAQLVSKSEYAKLRGCAPSAVTRAIKEGRIVPIVVDGRELIDPAVADIQWARNTRSRSDSNPATDAVRSPGGAGEGADLDIGNPGDIRAVRARRELAEAKLAEHKLAELRGELVRAAEVKAAWAKKATGLRSALLQIPARLAAVVAAETDQAKCHDLLQGELHQVLAQISGQAD